MNYLYTSISKKTIDVKRIMKKSTDKSYPSPVGLLCHACNESMYNYSFFENLLKYFSNFLSMIGVYFLSKDLNIKCKIISKMMKNAK